jgi:hypothetical protein
MLKATAFAITLLCPLSAHAADAPRLPPGVTCEAIRERVMSMAGPLQSHGRSLPAIRGGR